MIQTTQDKQIGKELSPQAQQTMEQIRAGRQEAAKAILDKAQGSLGAKAESRLKEIAGSEKN